jgi:protocatechuate 3,4-dioxygenase beta subunit
MSKRILLSFIILICAIQLGYTQITGTVYRDFNGNGTRQTSGATIEPGAGGVIINTYDASNNFVTSTTSAADGSYSLPYTVPVRLEFVLPSAGPGNYCTGAPLDFTGFGGDGNNVRFITGSSSAIDYAIHYPYDYVSNTNPAFFFPQYSNGNPLGGGTTGTTSGFKGHLYNHTGTTAPVQAVAYSNIGATWGVAYSKQAKVLFTSALIKRHSGLGPLGSGGIYKLTPTATSFTVDQFYDLDANGHNTRAGAGAPAYGAGSSYTLSGVNIANYSGAIDPLSNEPIGLGVVGTNTERNLPANFTTDNNDPAAMAQVGRVGLGDLDISDDGKYLFSVNLYQKVIHRLELNDPYNPTAIVGVTTFSIPAQAVTNGVLRPFGLGYQRGDLYLGTVASGENGGVNNVGGVTDLYAHVFRLKDAATGSATFESTPVLSMPLNYAKGPSVLNSANTKKWYPWNNSTSALLVVSGESTLPTPILSDIDFTDNGDMVLDFMDRSGHQFGYQNYQNLSGTTALFTYDIGGDLLIAGKDCSGNGFTIENNGAYLSANGTTYTSGAANNQGPGNSEFFKGDFYPTWHSETSIGSCAILKGNQNVLATAMDPINDFSSGFGKMSTTVGTVSGALQTIRTNDDFGKANGLGDVEIAGDEPPLEIGNRVWNDANGNGIQDPTEVGIANVTVELFCDFDNNQIPDGASIGSTNTDGNGHFYFNTSNITDGDCVTGGDQAGPQPGKNYLMIIGASDWVAGAGAGDLAGLLLAPANSASNGIADASDNDATSIANVPTIQVLTSTKWGDNNHTYDFGFMAPPPCTVTASVVAGNQTVCTGGDPVAFTETTPATGSGTLSYQWESSTTDCNSGFGPIGGANSNTYDPPTGLTQTTYYHLVVTNTDGSATCTDITNCITVTVSPYPTADAGSDATLNCVTTSVVIGTPAVAGNSYSWSPASGLSATNIAQPTASPSSTTTYTVTVTNADNCATTDMVTITIDNTAPTADAGVDMTVNCTTTQVMIGTAAIAGNSYSWSPSTALSADNVAQPNANPSSTTTYTVTVTGTNGCTASDVVTVTADTNPPSADAGIDKTLDCTTTSAVIGTAAIAGNTYSWSPATALSATNIAQPTANPTSTTNYTVTVTAANGCTASDVVTVTVNAGVPIADAGSDMTINCTTTSVTIGSVSIGGNSYSWSPSTGLSADNIAQPTATPSATTSYTVTVMNTTSLCTATDVVTVTVDNTPPTADAGSDMNLDCNTTSAQIGTAAVAGNTYSWSPSSGLSATNIAQPMASSTSTTTYTVTVTAANGCTATDVVTVNVNTTPPVADAGMDISLDCTTTSGTIGTAAIAGNTYSWSPSTGLSADNVAQPVANSSATTNYTVTVTAANGCTASDVVTVNVSAGVPVADAGIDQTINCTMLSVTIGTAGTAGNTYSWSPSTGLSSSTVAQPTATPSATTSYTVTVTNTTSLCTATDVVTVTVDNTPPTADAGIDMNLDCTTTSAQIGTAAVAGNTYSWSPSSGLSATNIAQPMASSTSTTTYTVTVTAANGCTATDVVTVNVNTTPPVADAGMDISLDCTTTSGTIGTAAVAGNTYSWSPSTGLSADNVAQPVANSSATTNYTVTVTAANGCTASDVVTVNVSAGVPVADAGIDQTINCTMLSVTIGTAGTAGNTYSWSPSTGLSADNIAQPTATPSATTSYTVTVTNTTSLCTATDVVTVTVDNTPPTADPGSDMNLDCTTTSAQIGTAAVAGNTYSWSPSSGLSATNIAQPMASSTSTTTYTVTVTAANGCTATDVVTVNVNTTPPVADAGMDISLDCTTASGTIGTAAVAGNTYSWSPSTGLSADNVAQPVANSSTTTNYTVTVTAANGCTASDVVTVNVSAGVPVADAGIDQTINCTMLSVTIGTAGTAGNTYSWSPSTGLSADNIAQPTATPSATTSYTVTVTNTTSLCTATDVVTVTVDNTPPTADAGSDMNLDCTTTSAQIGTAAVAGNTYSWSPSTGLSADNVAQPMASPSSNTTYTVTVTAANGCTTTDMVTLNVNTTPPTADAGLDKVIDCATPMVTIGTTAIVGNTYSWNPGTGLNDATSAEPNASPSTTTNYTVTVTAANGCTSTDAVTVTVNGNLGSVGNYVWMDENGNGIQDEPAALGINGVTVELWKETAPSSGIYAMVQTTTTASNAGDPGFYSFSICDLAQYKVKFPTTEAGSALTTQTATAATDNNSDANGADGFSPEFTIDPNGSGVAKDNMTIDAGYEPLGSIGNYVWLDENGNGINDEPATNGINGVTVNLLDASMTVIATTTTANDGANPGYYLFDELNSGTYYVQFPTTQSSNGLTTQTATPQTDNNSDADATTGNSPAVVLNAVGTGVDKDNMTIDAGYEPLGSIGNYVWLDENGNGINDEPATNGINGVTVNLLDASMTVIATTTTANDGANPGYYLFDELNSGTYYVQFPTTQSSNGLTTQTATAQTDNNSDADATTGNSPAVVLNAAGTGVDKDNMTIDAGYEPLGSIGNYVWLDENGNGINDEPATNGINGVTVNLLDASMTIIATTTTANDGANPGYYLFDELNSGTYYVQFPTTQSSNGLTTQTATAQTDNNSDADATTGNSPAVVINAAGTGVDKDNMTIDAGYEPLGSIGNYVWLDENGNGINDEPATNGINGVTVNLLDASMTVIATTTTANDGANPGYYLFDELNSGTYYVQFPTTNGEEVLTIQTTTPQTDNNSDADQTTGTSPAVVILASGIGMDKDNMTIDAGFAPLADLGNYVWNDINQNGSQDPTEVGVAGITVTLMNGAGAVLSSTITDAYGMYIFNDLNPGVYKVGFTLPANYVFTDQNNTTDELDSDVDPNNGVTGNYTLALGDSNITVDAGIYFEQPTTASVGNFVWFDTNNDGIQDPTETGISGVTVTLYDQFGNTVATMPTDASGYYLFTQVPPGTYSVGFSTPPGLSFSPNNGAVNNPSNSDANPGTGLTSSFVVVAGDEITTVDAGLSLLPSNVGSLGDKVWFDVDQDGEQENGETGVEGINVILYAGDGTTVLSTTTTNAFGDYIFNNLPQGDYVVGFTGLPTDYVLTTTSGLDSTSNSDANVVSGKTPVIHLAAGQHNMTYDAGIYNTNANNTNSLGNYVWVDANKDGIQDPGESGVPGVTVTLYNSFSNAIDKTSTDLNGFYLFPNLPNGTYFVGFSNIPSGFSFTTANNTADGFDSDADLTTGNTPTSTLSGGTNDLTLDAGIIPNSNKIGLGTLGDLVWYDLNNDGLQDPSEGGVQGVTATLYGPDGTTVLGTTVTDALGNYIFTGLDAGSYIVGFSNLPIGFTVSPQNADAQGVNGELNSDVNSGTLQTPLVSLATGEDKMSVDMGIAPPAGSASLGDLVWIDLNNDGLQTTGEPGVQGVTVTLYNGAGSATATTTTDANGNYYFVGLTPGTYGVGFSNLPAGYNLTTENSDAAGVNGGLNSDANATTGLTPTVNLLAGDNNLNLDAGLVSTTVASVGDYVWNDLNSDGVQDPNEPGLGGILVTLLDNLGNPVASTITKPDGSYIFTNVTPGTYSMNFSNTPIGMSFTTQETNPASNTGSNANAAGNTPPFTVTAGTHNPTIDAGLTAPLLAGVGDYVWLDANLNGVQDPGEAPIAGALVTLYDSDGIDVLGTAVTDGNGAYSFTNLTPNSYMLGFTLSQVFTPSGAQPAAITLLDSGADGVDNDADPGTGRTATFPLAAGEYNPTFDAGFYPNLLTPIELGDFTIETQHCDVLLAWTTLSEANTKQFNIERRLEGEGFVTIASVKAAGNSNTTLTYSHSDKNVLNGAYAYRLKMIDQDGKFAYSPLRTTTVNCSTSGLVQVYPIPAQDVLHVRLNVESDEVVELALTDAAGRVVAKQQEEVTSGDHILTMPINHVAAGVYYLRVTSGFNVQTFKVNKD